METFGLVGRLAVAAGLITEGQLLGCLQDQTKGEQDKPLGALLVERGYITQRQLEALLAAQARERYRQNPQPVQQAPRRAPITRESLPAVSEALGPRTADRDVVGPEKKLLLLLQMAWNAFASDLHLQAGSRPFMRVGGSLKILHHQPMESAEISAMLQAFMGASQQKALARSGDVTLAWDVEGNARLRVNCFMGNRGLGAAFRIHAAQTPTLNTFGLPPVLARCATYHKGLVLVTGPSGSGKTTTIAALIELLGQVRAANIVTFEDPIEFLHKPKKANILQRQRGRDFSSYQAALKSALRLDPDVIVFGDVRSPQMMPLVLTAAETGHLVLAAMPTVGAISTIERFVGAFPSSQQAHARAGLAESLRAIVSQQLVQGTSGRRLPITELVFNTQAVSHLIREDRTLQLPNAIQLDQKSGMRRFEDSLQELRDKGLLKASPRSSDGLA